MILELKTIEMCIRDSTIVGDGEAETGPLATAWHCNKFLNPVTHGAVLPLLHLNGYKISNPTVFARISHEEVEDFFKGCGWEPIFVEDNKDDANYIMNMHRKMAEALDTAIEKIKAIQKDCLLYTSESLPEETANCVK